MNYAIDASSVINLNNVDALGAICRLSRCRIWLSPLVLGECEPRCAAELMNLRRAGLLGLVNDDDVPTDLFLDLLSQHGLGAGETEAIAVCQALGYGLCCDDKRARSLGREILGTSRVIGTLRLLRWCVEERLLSCDEGFRLLRAMRVAGGFLPEAPQSFFCDRTATC